MTATPRGSRPESGSGDSDDLADRDVPEGDRPSDLQDDAPLDLSAIDPETWQPGVQWLPSLTLLAALMALPLVSLVLSGLVADRLAVEAPDQLWLVDACRALIAAAVVAGALLVLIVPLVAGLARGRPRLTIAILEVGFQIGVLMVAVVVLLHAGLGFAVVMAIERLVLGFALPGTAGIALFAGLASAVYLATAGLSALRTAHSDEPAVTLDPATAPGLHAMLDDLAIRIGVAPPDAVLFGPTMEFWAGQGMFRTLDTTVTGSVIHVSAPQMVVLSVPAVEGILAHELAHIRDGDTAVGARMSPAFDRVARSIEALDRESEGLARIAALPGILWLEFATQAMGAVAAEARRVSEMAADALAADVVGSTVMATALVASHAIGVIEDEWATEVDRAVEDDTTDPVEAFAATAREILSSVTTYDVLVQSLGEIRPSHPSLLARLRALGVEEPAFEPTDGSALSVLVARPNVEVRRLIDLLRPVDGRDDAVHLNAPRLTPSIVGWVLIGPVFAAILAYRLAREASPSGDLPLIAAVLLAVWLAVPIAYLWIQREVVFDGGGIHARPWWWPLDRDAKRLRWMNLRWTGTMELTVGFESFVTLSNGADRLRWWGAIWPKRELARLIDEVRDRGGSVRFSSLAGTADVERHAVIRYIADRFLVSQVRLAPNGDLLEMRPVDSFRAGASRLSLVLVDRLHEAVKPVGARNEVADIAYLASLAKVEETTFVAEAKRLTVHGSRESWTIRVDGVEGAWVTGRRTDEADLARAILEILGLDLTVMARRSGRRQAADASEATGSQAHDGPARDS